MGCMPNRKALKDVSKIPNITDKQIETRYNGYKDNHGVFCA